MRRRSRRSRNGEKRTCSRKCNQAVVIRKQATRERSSHRVKKMHTEEGACIKKGGKSPYQPSVTPLPGQLSEYKQLVLIMRCVDACLKEPCTLLYSYIQTQYYIKTSLSDPP